MKGYWDNLRSFEKRVVVAVLALFFIVLNWLFVFPHFSDLAYLQRRMQEAQKKLTDYTTAIDQKGTYARLIHELEKGGGASVPQEDQAFQFQNAVNIQASESGVQISGLWGRLETQTNNPFFLEKSQGFNVQGGEPQMVDFLYSLGRGESSIRIKDLTLKPEPQRHQLTAQVKLVASFQKKIPGKPGTPAGQPAPNRLTTGPAAGNPEPLAKTVSPTNKRP